MRRFPDRHVPARTARPARCRLQCDTGRAIGAKEHARHSLQRLSRSGVNISARRACVRARMRRDSDRDGLVLWYWACWMPRGGGGHECGVGMLLPMVWTWGWWAAYVIGDSLARRADARRCRRLHIGRRRAYRDRTLGARICMKSVLGFGAATAPAVLGREAGIVGGHHNRRARGTASCIHQP